MNVQIRPATQADIPFILHGNDVIDQLSDLKPKRGLTADHIKRDVFGEKPIASIDIVMAYNEDTGQVEQAAFVIYSFFYLASEGNAIWMSKFYIDPFSRKKNIGPLIAKYLFDRYPDCPSIFGAVGFKNKVARVFFSSLGADRYDDFPLYGVKRSRYER